MNPLYTLAKVSSFSGAVFGTGLVDEAMGVLPFDPGIDKALGRPGLRIAPTKQR